MIQIQNGSDYEVKSDLSVGRWLAGINAGGALISAGFAVVALIDPAAIGDGAVTTLVELYAGAYAVRAIPLTAVLLFLLARRATTPAIAPILVLAGLTQFGDAAVGMHVRQPGMVIGGSLLAMVHLLSAVWLYRRRTG
jgi:hypothetical protein